MEAPERVWLSTGYSDDIREYIRADLVDEVYRRAIAAEEELHKLNQRADACKSLPGGGGGMRSP